MNGRFGGRVALVTGGGRGIGRAVARRLHQEGAALAIIERDPDRGAEVVRELGADRALAIVGDVSDPGDVTDAVGAVLERFGRLDVVCNNAGVDDHRPLADWSPEAFDHVLAVDLRGVFLVSQATAAYLAKNTGSSIINVASIMAWFTAPGYEVYTAAKAGVLGLTRSLASELGPLGVRVNVICPGFIDTDLWEAVLRCQPEPETYARRVTDVHPLRRRGTPEDVAAVVAFLASEDAGFITGADLVVDGGVTVQLPQFAT